MGKIIGWVLNFTKVGKAVEPVQKTLSGWKSYLAGAALAIPAFITILIKFSEQGTGYLVTLLSSEEWALFMNGIAVMGLRAAVTKAANPSKDPNEPVPNR